MMNTDDYIIENGELKKYNGQGGDVEIPAGTTSIGADAFYRNMSITSVVIPEGVTIIGDHAFYYCSRLTRVVIPRSVTSIGRGAFEECTRLSSVVIPDRVTSIGDRTFECCRSLTSVSIPNSVTSIGNRVFYRCESLTSVSIPDSVTSIGDAAFYGCKGLADSKGFVIVGGNLFDYTGSDETVVIPEGVTSIGSEALWGKKYTSVLIPESVTRIGDEAFKSSDMESVVIPESVTYIGNNAFSSCKKLTSIVLPKSVTSIGRCAFASCVRLSHLSIPKSLKDLGEEPFRDQMPTGLLGEIDTFYHALADADLKKYVLVQGVWNKMPASTQTEIYLNRQGKSLQAPYLKMLSKTSVNNIRIALLERMTGEAQEEDCNLAGNFLTAFYEKLSTEDLQELYDRLLNEKNSAKAIKNAKKKELLMKKLEGANETGTPVVAGKEAAMTTPGLNKEKKLFNIYENIDSLDFSALLKAANTAAGSWPKGKKFTVIHENKEFIVTTFFSNAKKKADQISGGRDAAAELKDMKPREEVVAEIHMTDPNFRSDAEYYATDEFRGQSPRLNPKQLSCRLNFIAAVATLISNQETMAAIAANAPKKKNGTLYKGRVQKIALSGICDSTNKVYAIVARNKADTNISITFEEFASKPGDLEEWNKDFISEYHENLPISKALESVSK